MIVAKLAAGGTSLAASLSARLARKAGLIAQARAEAIVRARKADPLRWRIARLLWPLFAKDC